MIWLGLFRKIGFGKRCGGLAGCCLAGFWRSGFGTCRGRTIGRAAFAATQAHGRHGKNDEEQTHREIAAEGERLLGGFAREPGVIVACVGALTNGRTDDGLTYPAVILYVAICEGQAARGAVGTGWEVVEV